MYETNLSFIQVNLVQPWDFTTEKLSEFYLFAIQKRPMLHNQNHFIARITGYNLKA